MKKSHSITQIIAALICLIMIASTLPVSVFAITFDEATTGDYYNVLSQHEYTLAPGATETEIILNNDDGSRRQIVHVMEVDTKNPTIKILPGYYGIDKLDPDNLADKTYWKASPLTETVKYYENELGYNVVGAMNTALAYDSEAPYSILRYQGVDLADLANHSGKTSTYLAVKADGTCELRDIFEPLEEDDWTAVGANFGWLVKDGKMTTTTVERTSSPASRSMIGIKVDGTLVLCQVDGRVAPIATGLSNYEMSEMMLSLGCVNAFNCDGGGSSTFVTKREGETEGTMRSIPSDGAERATINSVMVVSTARPTGIFDHVTIESDYDYMVPGAAYQFHAFAVDDAGYEMDMPADVQWALSDASFGTVENGLFISNGKLGAVDVQIVYNGEVAGSKMMTVVNPDVFKFTADATVIPYGKAVDLELLVTYGSDSVDVYIGDQYSLTISDSTAAILAGNTVTATTDESKTGIVATATYLPNSEMTATIDIGFGKGSEIVYDFEDGERAGFAGFDEAKQWSIDNDVNNSLVGSKPLDGQFYEYVKGQTFVSTVENGGQVKNGEYALGWTLDNTNGNFPNWTYNVLFNVGETIVLRDVENGKMATSLGMWLYIPEGAAGLAFQSQFYTKDGNGGYVHKQDHFTFTTVSGAVKNLNSCTEADIPESRWVYASIDISKYDYLCTPVATYEGNLRSPSFIRTYVKPNAPAKMTFYIDDITLDYSSAVEDRVAPTITDFQYAISADTLANLNDGMTLVTNDANKIIHGFYAVVSDNIGLDESTRQIYIDGVPMHTSLSGNKMYTTYHYLTNGTHTITFEIADKFGNYTRVTKTVVFNDGSFGVSLGGHNNSGAAPEAGSIYYVDINVSDLSKVDKLVTTLKLQSANTWEPKGAVVADGFKATFVYNEVTALLDVVVEKTRVTAAEAATIVSIPVRIWTWDGISSITGEALSPEVAFASKIYPTVTVECEVVYGNIEGEDFNESDMGSFAGVIFVDTNIVANNTPWHEHTPVAVDDKAATCTEDGYTGRTYCEECASVADWGTIETATGHDYEVNESSKLVCHCGEEMTMNGLYKDGDVYRYLMNGVAKSGWLTVGKDWYYFHPDTLAAKAGKYKVGVVEYEFEETGKLISGVWAKTLFGTRYYYGPSCYATGWQEIDGETYYFENTYRYEGYRMIFKGNFRGWYLFDENGALVDGTIADGFYTEAKGTSYVVNGEAQTGLFKVGNDYYYAGYWGYLMGGKQYAGTTSCDLPAGNYEFDANGKMLNGLVAKEDGNYYYVNGNPAKEGLYNIDGNYYYATWTGKCATGKQFASNTYCDLAKGEYYFDAEGKLANGLVETADGLIYVVNGKTTGSANGLYKYNDDYYYVTWGGTVATGKQFVYNTYCDLPIGNYEFGDDGKMLNGIVDKDGTLYYYENGLTGSYGMVKVGGDYYFSNWGGVVMTSNKYYVGTTKCDLPVGNYEFGADGKMLRGIVEKDGQLYYYVNGLTGSYGLVKFGDDYYFSNWGGVVMTDGVYYVGTTKCDLPIGNYEFGADGKMLRDIIDKDGKLYYYKNGLTGSYGLVKVGEDYYFSNWGGVVMADGTYYVGTTYCDLPVGNYEFGADGKMLRGIVDKDGKLYYYVNGLTGTYGLIKIGDDYYFSNWGGVIMTDGAYYVGTTFCDLPAGKYTFDAEGKMLNGFVTKDDGIYYYSNGNTPAPGVIEVDGEYYFVSWGGKIVTNQTFFVWNGNGYTIEGNYKFDEFGRIYA